MLSRQSIRLRAIANSSVAVSNAGSGGGRNATLINRYLATQTETTIKSPEIASTQTLEQASPFSALPGPTKLQFIRNMLPGGRYSKSTMFEMGLSMNAEYGPIFRLPGVLGNPDIIMTFNPPDYETVFRNEGQYPYRRGFATFDYYREVHNPKLFQRYGGLIMTNGKPWADTRSAVNPILMQPKNARLYFQNLLDVNDEFLLRIREIRNAETDEMPADFEDDMRRLILESISAVALNTQLGLLRQNRDSAESKAILDAMRRFLTLAFELDILPPIWKIIKTPKFHEFMGVVDTLMNFANKYVQHAFARLEQDGDAVRNTAEAGKQEQSVLEKLARIDKNIAIVMATDLMIAGVDPTTVSLTGILFGLSKNPEKQNKLLEEIKTILPEKNSTLTMDSLRNMPYLRACIKEGIRLYPIGPGTMRRMPHDVVLSGYRIPAGTDVAMGANLQMGKEPFVPRAKEFVPERWLRSNDSSKLVGDIATPFMYLPFGFGPRSCAGKRIVDLLLEITLARLVRNFEIEYNYPLDNPISGKFFVAPTVPLKFKFTERQQ